MKWSEGRESKRQEREGERDKKTEQETKGRGEQEGRGSRREKRRGGGKEGMDQEEEGRKKVGPPPHLLTVGGEGEREKEGRGKERRQVAGMKQVRALALLGRGALRKKRRGAVKSAGQILMCSLLQLLLSAARGCCRCCLQMLASCDADADAYVKCCSHTQLNLNFA